MFPHLQKFNLQKWIDENRADWGQRRVIWRDSDFIAFVTRGPNRRKDYHINPGDEIFYQLEGELKLHYLKDNKQNIALLQPGDIFLLCSDGLSNAVDDVDVEKILLGCEDPERNCQDLIDRANANGGPDNIRVVVVRISP